MSWEETVITMFKLCSGIFFLFYGPIMYMSGMERAYEEQDYESFLEEYFVDNKPVFLFAVGTVLAIYFIYKSFK